jgi:hypothetical protein
MGGAGGCTGGAAERLAQLKVVPGAGCLLLLARDGLDLISC